MERTEITILEMLGTRERRRERFETSGADSVVRGDDF
jgi:hypothetical protein